MVPIAATFQVSVMTHKNTCCSYGFFWKLLRGSQQRAAVLVVYLPGLLHGWDGNQLMQPGCVCCPRGEQEGLASEAVVEPRLRVWHLFCSEGMHLTCC